MVLSMAEPFQQWRQRLNAQAKLPLAVLFSLYLAQGLPLGFMTQALPTLLRHYGVSLTDIGLSGILLLPWAIKFLWAPVIDHYANTRLGHYRAWILWMQLATLICLLILAVLPVGQLQQLSALWGLFFVLLAMNFFCASQDNATDALAVKILRRQQLHWGNSFQVIGSRLGYICGGGAVLYAIDVLSWSLTFGLLAFLVALNSVLIVIYHEPPARLAPPAKAQLQPDQLKNLYLRLWQSPDYRLWLLVLLSHKCADGLAGPVLKPMMIDMGLSLTQIGINITMLGAIFAVLGAWLANALIARSSLSKMLLVFTLLQPLNLLYYWYLAYCFEHGIDFGLWQLYLANIFEESCSAMALVALLSLMMQHARQQFAATDFSVQVAILTLVSGGLYLFAGKLAELLGYSNFLLWIVLIAMLCCLPKWYWYRISAAKPAA
jgi:PAT family beta-lactamase induction signal transducer AmpG